MTNLTRVPLKIVIGGLDVSAALHPTAPIELQRAAFGFVAAPIASMSFSLVGGVLNEPLNPTRNNRWQPGTPVTVQIDLGTGWEAPPYGGSLVIKNANNYDDGRPLFGKGAPSFETLGLELTDALGLVEQPEYPQRPYYVETQAPISLSEAITQSLGKRAIAFASEPGDPVPTRQLNIMLGKVDLGDSLPLWTHQLAWCSPDAENQVYGIYCDNSGAARIFELDLGAAPILTRTEAEIPGFRFGVGSETEQLPGAIEAEGVVIYQESIPDPTPKPHVIFDDDGSIAYRDLEETSLPRFPYYQNITRTRKWQRRNELHNDEAAGTSLVQAFDSREVTSYSYDRVSLVRTETILPLSLISGNPSDPDFPILGEVIEERPEYDAFGRVYARDTKKYTAWGLLRSRYNIEIPTAVSESALVLESGDRDTWEPIGNGVFTHRLRRYHRVFSGQTGKDGRQTGANYGPPNYGAMPQTTDLTERKIFASVPLSYDDVSISGAVALYGDGSLAITAPSTFTGYGVYASSGGLITAINGGAFAASDGTFTGTGWFRGSGSFTGKKLLSRARPLQFGNLCPSLLALQRTAFVEGALLVGRHYGHQIELNLRDVPRPLPPGRILEIVREDGDHDFFLINGEEIAFNEQVEGRPCTLYRCIGLWLGKEAGGNFKPSIQRLEAARSFEGREVRVFEDGDGRLAER